MEQHDTTQQSIATRRSVQRGPTLAPRASDVPLMRQEQTPLRCSSGKGVELSRANPVSHLIGRHFRKPYKQFMRLPTSAVNPTRSNQSRL